MNRLVHDKLRFFWRYVFGILVEIDLGNKYLFCHRIFLTNKLIDML